MTRQYWLNLFSIETWEEFLAHGGTTTGFSEARWKTVQQIERGDFLLCYLTGVSRWVGILEVVGPAFRSEEPIWTSATYPCRLPVREVMAIKRPEYGIPVLDMRKELSVFDNLGNPNQWSGPFRGSPVRWKSHDGEAVVRAVRQAVAEPVERPLRRRGSPHRRSQAHVIETPDATMTLPDEREQGIVDAASASMHTEIQYLLLKLGASMGFDVHVARNDLSRVFGETRFADMPRRRATLPNQFDKNVSKIIELIDVLWLDRSTITAAFEIESTTTIYSGLLRMSDLLALQPNLSIPLFLVSHDEWRDRVIEQVNRPTFANRESPLNEVCRFIPFQRLRDEVNRLGDVLNYLRLEWLQEISESCQPPL